ncbi:hypothetical protein [Candidatus Phytoplasma rubi]|uniref:hypothetical protein n=1 Tax=Candidatus Phytoplasma rubi TaxID=399025 RepID=UPI002286B266|nr:hypothetical protein [Candidatus Phytoplasma rubi]
MKINLKQNSWAWYQHRKNFVNASEIGNIMGLNPYETKKELIKKNYLKVVLLFLIRQWKMVKKQSQKRIYSFQLKKKKL